MIDIQTVRDADMHIEEELYLAGIPMQNTGHSLEGKIGKWLFHREAETWIAQSPDGEGMPIPAAIELHQAIYPVAGRNQPRTYGEVVHGMIGEGIYSAEHPLDCASHYDSQGNRLMYDPTGILEADMAESLVRVPGKEHLYEPKTRSAHRQERNIRFVPTLEGNVAYSCLTEYAIETQQGLNEFARRVKFMDEDIRFQPHDPGELY